MKSSRTWNILFVTSNGLQNRRGWKGFLEIKTKLPAKADTLQQVT